MGTRIPRSFQPYTTTPRKGARIIDSPRGPDAHYNKTCQYEVCHDDHMGACGEVADFRLESGAPLCREHAEFVSGSLLPVKAEFASEIASLKSVKRRKLDTVTIRILDGIAEIISGPASVKRVKILSVA